MIINNKFKKNKSKLDNILLIMILIYILGVILGCFLIYIYKDSSNFLLTILKNSISISLIEEISVFSWAKNLMNDAVFFILVFLFKYSGVLKIFTSSIPLLFGVKNAIQYCMANINGVNLFKILMNFTIKDTAISFLCTSAVLSEIIKQKEDIKYDFQLLSAYLVALLSVYIIDVGLKMLIL